MPMWMNDLVGAASPLLQNPAVAPIPTSAARLLTPGLGGVGHFLAGDYNPQNMLLNQLTGGALQQTPMWARIAGNLSSMGPIGFSRGNSSFYANPSGLGNMTGGGNPMQTAMIAAILQQGRTNTPIGAAQPIVVKNSSTVTDMAPGQPGGVRAVNPVRSYDPYRADKPVGGQQYDPFGGNRPGYASY